MYVKVGSTHLIKYVRKETSVMKKSICKVIAMGALCGVMLTSVVGAATLYVEGTLYTKNPLYSAPKGYSDTYGYKKITAKCTVSKSGYTTRSVSSSKSLKSGFGGVETDWISGPTYKSSGTKFVSKHTGYSHDGIYSELKASKKY